jgi:hypothetical protein
MVDLAVLHGFTAEELEANRRGVLHPHQADVVRKVAQRGCGCSVALAALSMVVCILLGVNTPKNLIPSFFGLGILGGLALLWAWSSWRSLEQTREGVVSSIDSAIEKSIETIGRPPRRVYVYRVSNKKVFFHVPYAAWQALPTQATYRIYYLPGHSHLLSLESLS